jgi:putative NADH-flavin reductase
MRVIVFGANSSTGRLVTSMAMTAGHTVTAITRRPADFLISDHRVQVADADVMDADAVDWVVRDHDAVLSVIGAPLSPKPATVCSQAAYNVVKAMMNRGVRRLLCVGSPDLDPADLSRVSLLCQQVIRPVVFACSRAVQQDVRRMENIVRETGLDWTLFRPGRLVTRSDVTDYRITAEPAPRALTSRVDLAHALVREVTHRDYVGETVHVATVPC